MSAQSIFSMIYEGIGQGGYQPTLEYFEWTNIKAFKAFFSKTKKEAQQHTKTGNSLFRAKSYKEAKSEYQKALKLWKEIQSSIKTVDEKEPGWFKSDNLVYFIPFVNIITSLLLTYAQDSAIRYVPKFVVRDSNANKEKEYQSGSVTKATLVASINEVLTYCEFQIKACDKPNGVALEAATPLEENMDMLIEAVALLEEYGSDGYC